MFSTTIHSQAFIKNLTQIKFKISTSKKKDFKYYLNAFFSFFFKPKENNKY